MLDDTQIKHTLLIQKSTDYDGMLPFDFSSHFYMTFNEGYGDFDSCE